MPTCWLHAAVRHALVRATMRWMTIAFVIVEMLHKPAFTPKGLHKMKPPVPGARPVCVALPSMAQLQKHAS